MPIVTPYIPEYITVHLGPPGSAAQNVTVSFSDYIKNVASSEIYPTWDDSAVLANIYAQISFALNRIYLEFYPSQGYNFNITSSTAYDQSFNYGRNIFDNISVLVDEVFNDYIRRIGTLEPLAAKYCNGTTVTCDGLSQWGSENLAQQGLNSVQILKNYYGDDIELVIDAPVMGIMESYPGTPLRLGSSGNSVRTIQVSLNRISQDYPLINKINPVNSIFDESTENAVRVFQRIFNLTQDGIVGKATWYKIVTLYTGVKRLSELESEGVRLFGISLEYPDAISPGDTGEKVTTLQYFLSILAEFYSNMPFVQITGTFGPETTNAVIAFQKNHGLEQTGIVGSETWDLIYRDFLGIIDTVFLVREPTSITAQPSPNEVLKLGSSGSDVRYLQSYLNVIALAYPEIPLVTITGVFDQQTMLSVMKFQELFGLPATGQVDRNTWVQITDIYKSVISSSTPRPIQNPGFILKLGTKDANTEQVG